MHCALGRFVAPVVFTAGLLSVSVAAGQEILPAKDVGTPKPQLKTDILNNAYPPYTPITLKQKYKYSVEQIFSGPRLAAILTRSSLEQVEVTPHAWGSNAPSFGVRIASQFGRSFVRTSIATGIRAIDHEDPRYFYSHKKRSWDRTKYAIVQTFEVRNDNGSMMPAYSRFLGDFGMPFLAQTWHPNGINVGDALHSGGVAICMGMGMNIAQEFWPDVKRALLHRGPGTAGLIAPGTPR